MPSHPPEKTTPGMAVIAAVSPLGPGPGVGSDRREPFLFARVHFHRGHAAGAQSEVRILIVGRSAEGDHAQRELVHQLCLPDHSAFA